MTRRVCPFGDDCDLTVAWVAGQEEARDSFRQRLEEMTQEWQPIETAPKNKLVLISDGGEVALSAWGKVSHVPIYGWLNLMLGPEDVEIIDMRPTHWMPIPAPPRATGEAKP